MTFTRQEWLAVGNSGQWGTRFRLPTRCCKGILGAGQSPLAAPMDVALDCMTVLAVGLIRIHDVDLGFQQTCVPSSRL
jgi:hypothetical protein